MHRRFTLAAALSGALLVVAPATAQSDNGQTLTFKEVNKGSTFKFIDNPPRAKNPRRPSVSAGDAFVVTTPLASNAGKHIGRLQATCTFTKGASSPNKAASAICYGVFTFAQGQLDALVAMANTNSTTTTGGIIGGTGTYAGARGTLKSVQTKTGGNDTVTLLGS